MADLSGHAPIYVRTTGDDSTGDGSSGSPFATAQKGFEVAYNAGSGNYVLDLGVGNFGGVNLFNAAASEWPSRISVRGSGATQSFLGGLDAHSDEVYDGETNTTIVPAADGRNVHIISDRTVNLGGIDATGGDMNPSGNFQQGMPYGPTGRAGGDVTLVDVVAGDVLFSALLRSWYYGELQEGRDGGTGIISGSTVGNIVASGGPGGRVSGNGGSVTVTNSVTGDITSDAGPKEDGYMPSGDSTGTDGGVIALIDSTAGNISANGGNTYNPGNDESSGNGGQGGVVSLLRSVSGTITAEGGGAANKMGGDGGAVTITYSESGTISVLSKANLQGINAGEDGTVTLVGKCVLPSTIQAGEVFMGDLRRGRGLNGSDVLGIA